MEKNIYDERVYLVGDNDALSAFRNECVKNRFLYSLERELYKDVLKEYRKLISMTADLLRTLGLSSSIDYSLALSYLIKNGFLSQNLTFDSKEPTFEVKSTYGINIIMGEGCCRNYSDLHKAVMEELQLFCKSFYCVADESMSEAKTLKANHVLNLVNYEDVLYGIDIFNSDKLFYFKTAFILKEIAHFSSSKLRYKPYYDLTISSETYDEMIENIMLFDAESKKRHLSAFQYWDAIVPDMKSYMKKNRDMFMDFHSDTSEIKDNICAEMQRQRKLKEQLTKED